MSDRVFLGIAEPTIAGETSALIDEVGEFVVTGRASTAADLLSALDDDRADIVLLHDSVGPLPVLDLAREVGARHPQVSVLLVSRMPTPDLLRGAMQAGVRGVLELPMSLEALHADLASAGAWSRTVRARLAAGRDPQDERTARMVAVAGAKGGVGTTTVAVQLALLAAAEPGQSVCLVDFDLQGGDVRALLDLSHRRSVVDLLEVAEDLTPRNLDEALYHHASGLRVLLPPADGERGEEVHDRPARQILSGLRARFDVVVVDVGTTVTEASAVATELADSVIVLTTPDVLSMRAANRLLSLWERLNVRKDDVTIVATQVSKAMEVQPDLVGKVVAAPLSPTTIPAAFRTLQTAVNTGNPAEAADSPVRGAVAALGLELGIVRGGATRRGRRLRGSSGQASVEAMGIIPIALVVIALIWQLGLTGVTYVFAGHAAREGARAYAVGEPVAAAALDDVPGAWRSGASTASGGGGTRGWVEVRLRVPALFPGVPLPVTVPARVGTVREADLG